MPQISFLGGGEGGLVEKWESLKLVVNFLSKDLQYKSNNSPSLHKENGTGNINAVDNTTSTPIVPPIPTESLTSAKTMTILGDLII